MAQQAVLSAHAATADLAIECRLFGCFDGKGNRLDPMPISPQHDLIAEENLKRSPIAVNIGEIIARHAQANGVPLELAHAVVWAESTYRIKVRGAAGEVGLMQIMPATAELMGYRGTIEDLFHPETNIAYGMMYLGGARKRSDGSICGTILKYNAGHGAKRMNPISAAYCAKVMERLGVS
ncbi:MAG: transglycosylase SLT domain-containing protein [Rhizobiaceae bacterium]|nr:transglycosylase SLT domain-containing protein [Rhizobiaceae bacterium]